ncbi:GyrI-like domain-containing protein [Clostridioides difficile]|nr:GyrI-like domain-containing protein [Clostridioides difficile]
MSYKIEIKNIEPVTAATMRYNGLMTEATKYFPNVFKSIKGKSNGAPFFCYYNVDQKTGIGEMELCVPTSEIPNRIGVTIKEFPKTKALFFTHIGSYSTLPKTYEMIFKYIHENNIEIQTPWREVFIKGPGMLIKGNPDKYITEIIFPLKEEE